MRISAPEQPCFKTQKEVTGQGVGSGRYKQLLSKLLILILWSLLLQAAPEGHLKLP